MLHPALDRRVRANPDERGASAAELGLLVGLIAVIVLACVTMLGSDLTDISSLVKH